jgi:hypothetical protein
VKLLELIEKHQENWDLILEDLNKEGMCIDFTIEDLINYFVSLPRRRISKLKEEYEPQQFLLENYTTARNSISDSIAERTLNKSIELSAKVKDLAGEEKPSIWKRNLDGYMMLEIQKIRNRIEDLQSKQTLAVQTMRKLSKIRV